MKQVALKLPADFASCGHALSSSGVVSGAWVSALASSEALDLASVGMELERLRDYLLINGKCSIVAALMHGNEFLLLYSVPKHRTHVRVHDLWP